MKLHAKKKWNRDLRQFLLDQGWIYYNNLRGKLNTNFNVQLDKGKASHILLLYPTTTFLAPRFNTALLLCSAGVTYIIQAQ